MYLDIINTIKETQGTNAKLAILSKYKDDECFKKILLYTYNPFYQYYIKKISNAIWGSYSVIATYEQMFQLLDDLKNRIYTGNTAIDKVDDFICHSNKNLANVFKLILMRDLKTGLGITSINKIIPNLIPTFDVMLAESGVDIDEVIKTYGWVYVQKKSDGKRCITVCKQSYGGEITVDFYSRSGKEIDNLYNHLPLVNTIIQLRKFNTPINFILDGELIIENEDGTDVNRQFSNGLINRKNLSKKEIERFSYIVWDIVNFDLFINDIDNVKYVERFNILSELFEEVGGNPNCLKLIPTYTAKTTDEVMKITDYFIKSGFEGSIVKTPYHFYQRKRSKDWIKFKDVREADLMVVGYKYGNAGTKYEKILGSLICESSDGLVKVDVGTGFSDQLRNEIKEDIVGSIISVQYNQLISNASGGYSLYLPRLSEIRTDKEVADDFEKIKLNG